MKRSFNGSLIGYGTMAIFLLLAILIMPLAAVGAPNPIEVENSVAGSPPGEWDISGAGDATIQGFATDISVNKGETVRFKIDTDATSYSINIYRIGYYSGTGARFITTVTPTVTLPQSQPACNTDSTTKLTDCGNWSESASWNVPSDAVSGVYIAKLVRTDTGGASHIIFVVRDDNGGSDLLFKTSDTTWQAYNNYGGGSIEYPDYGYPSEKAKKVSYNRPFVTRQQPGGLGDYNWFFHAEYPMIRWLEANGYNVSYFTSVDADRYGAEILEHKVLLSVGHDEYWSGQERTNVEAARAAGINLAFFSGNTMYRKIRWEDSYRTMVCYNESNASTTVDPADPPIWTGTWRDARFSPPADGGRPENALLGTLFTVSEGPDALGMPLEVPYAFSGLRFWRNTAVASLISGQTATLGERVVGYEYDEDVDNGHRPAGLTLLSSTTAMANAKLLGANVDRGQDIYLPGMATHVMTLYRDLNALVFSAGTVQWSWGLDENHDNGPAAADLSIKQATVNLFADMDVQPTTLQAGLVLAAASTDTTPPTSTIALPVSGGTTSINTGVTIMGAASDSGGGVVAGVEVSLDNGVTWHQANGRENWNYYWNPTQVGPVTLVSRAIDDSGNVGASSSGVSISVVSCTSNCTIWPDTAVPSVVDSGSDISLEVGVKFKADTSGYITGIRFYKANANAGTHIANLWTSGGTLLASAMFANETSEGWQQVDFYEPVLVSADTVYVASYHANYAHYSTDEYQFATSGVDSPPLHALADAAAAGNGVYGYGSESVFPTNSFRSTNYWVDVVFSETPPLPPTLLSITVTPASKTISSGKAQQYTATGNYANGSQDITDHVTWASSNESVATIDSTGYAVAVSEGSSIISAALGGVTGTSTVNVQNDTLTITTQSLPIAAMGVEYSFTLAASGGTPPYTSWTVVSGSLPSGMSLNNGTGEIAGTTNSAGTYRFTAQVTDGTAQTVERAMSITVGSTILIITSSSNPFSTYYAEILRAEGITTFALADISDVSAQVLALYDVVILGEMPVSASQKDMLDTWVIGGGKLIAMNPDPQLNGMLGLTGYSGEMSDAYLKVDTSSGPGIGIVGETIQYHGAADLYETSATILATLYTGASLTSATSYPAVTLRNYGSGQAAAFTYDLARSVVYTRQGNPAWEGQHRDGYSQIRSDDLFYGNATTLLPPDPQPDWVNLDKVAIPQADEQQRLLANMLIQMNMDNKPMPRFWYLPRNLKAAVVMSGDDHGIGGTSGTIGRFESQLNYPGTAGCSVEDWECVRSTSYIYPVNAMTDAEAVYYSSQGFEIGAHISTNCADWTPTTLEAFFVDNLSDWSIKYEGIPSPSTNRLHCVVYSDYASLPNSELAHGIRFDTNYYYWPPSWVNDRPGFFTGSGMPMRFADKDGNLIDVYQATTQITDESGQSMPYTIDTMLDRAIGPEGYYGVITVNAHTDTASTETLIEEFTVNSALERGVPVVSARQMLSWLDGRNASTASALAWNGNTLSFMLDVNAGAVGLMTMVPVPDGRTVYSVTHDGVPILPNPLDPGDPAYDPDDPSYLSMATIKGLLYARFPAGSGSYQVNYALPDTIINTMPQNPTNQTSAMFSFSATEIVASAFECKIDAGAFAPCTSPMSYGSLSAGSHTFSVRALDPAGNPDLTPASYSWMIDVTAPTVTISSGPTTTLTNTDPVSYTVTYSGADSVVLTSNAVSLNVTGTANGVVQVSGDGTTTRTVTISGITGDGTLGITVAAGTASDLAGNTAAEAGPSETFIVDNTPPGMLISAPSVSAAKSGASVTYTVTYSGADAVALSTDDITLDTTNGASGTVAVSGTGTVSRTVTISALDGDGTLGITIAAGTASDAAGNQAAAAGPSATFIVDNTPPGMLISAPSVSVAKTGTSVTYTVTYSGADAVALSTDDITLDTTNGASGTVAVSGGGTVTRTVTISNLAGDGTLGISIAAGTASDFAGNMAAGAGPSAIFTVDNTPPEVLVSSPSVSIAKNGTNVTFTVSYAGADAVTLANGNVQLYSTTGASGTVAVSGDGTVTRTVTISNLTGDGTLGISIAAGTASDFAGNTAVGAGPSATFTVDNTPPSLVISTPSVSIAKNGTNVMFTVSYAGADAVTLANGNVQLNSTTGAGGTVSVSGDGTVTRTVTISDLTGNGKLGISIAAGTASDAAGNLAAGAGPSATFTVDNTPPGLSISEPSVVVAKSGTSVTYTVTYTGADAVALSTDDITLNPSNGASGSVAVSGDGTATRTVTISDLTGDGTLGISIAAGTASDAAGNLAGGGSSATFTVDNTGPTVEITSTAPELTNLSPIPFQVTFSEAVSDFSGGDVTVGNGHVGSLSGTGSSYTVNITPDGNGVVTVDIAAGAAHDAAGNGNTAAAQFSRTFDSEKPTVSIATSLADPTNTSPIPVTVTFSKTVSGFAIGDVDVNNGIPSDFAGSGNSYSFNVTPAANGTVSVSIAAGVAQDAAGNDNFAAIPLTIVYDTSAPTVSITSQIPDPTNATPIPVTVTFNEGVSGFTESDVVVTNGTIGSFSAASSSVYILSVVPGSDGAVLIDIGGDIAQDAAGNGNTAAAQFSRTFDSVRPTVTVDSPSPDPTNAAPIPMTVTFSKAVTGLALGDVDVVNGTASNLGGSGNTYTFNVMPTSDGTISVSIAAGVAHDAAGNDNTASAVFTRTYDTVAPTVAIGPPSVTVANSSISVTYVVTYAGADAVTLSGSDVTLNAIGGTGGTVAVTGDGATSRIVTISGITGYGTLGISIASATASDLAGNQAGTAGPSSTFTVDNASGDLNGDREVNMLDALKVLRIAAGVDAATGAELAHGDVAPIVNGNRQPDGKVDLGDVIVILRRAVNLTDW